MTGRLDDWMTEWPSDQVTKWPSDQVSKWPSDRVTKWPNDQVTGSFADDWPYGIFQLEMFDDLHNQTVLDYTDLQQIYVAAAQKWRTVSIKMAFLLGDIDL